MRITKQYLKSRFDYDPKKDVFIYKENKSKRVDWNERFSGTEVKPLINAGRKYMWVDNALYSVSQLIKLWEEGDIIEAKPITLDKLQLNKKRVDEAISKMSIGELNQLTKSIFLDQDMRLIVEDVLNRKRQTNKPNKKKWKSRMVQANDKSGVRDYFDENSLEVNVNTQLPFHIYYDEIGELYYVKVIYLRSVHKIYGMEDLAEALKVRKEVYRQIIEADKRGVDMDYFKCKIEPYN